MLFDKSVSFRMVGKLLGLHAGPGPRGGMPSIGGVFAKDSSRSLGEFWRKSQKTPNDYVHKRERIEPGTSRLLLLEQNFSATGEGF